MRVFRRWVYRLRHSRSLFPAFGALVVVVSVALLATIAVFSIRGEQAATTAVQQENGRLAERNQVLNDLAAQEAQLAQAEAQLTLLVRDDLSNQQANKAFWCACREVAEEGPRAADAGELAGPDHLSVLRGCGGADGLRSASDHAAPYRLRLQPVRA
jgi:hypothetical protein